MATLAADKPRVFEVGHDDGLNELPVIADDIIYEGAAVGESSSAGTARPLVAGDAFLGFADARADNAGKLAGAERVRLRSKGVAKLTITGVDNINDLGEPVYASDDDTFTLVASGNSAIGKLIRYESSSGMGLVAFEAGYQRSI